MLRTFLTEYVFYVPNVLGPMVGIVLAIVTRRGRTASTILLICGFASYLVESVLRPLLVTEMVGDDYGISHVYGIMLTGIGGSVLLLVAFVLILLGYVLRRRGPVTRAAGAVGGSGTAPPQAGGFPGMPVALGAEGPGAPSSAAPSVAPAAPSASHGQSAPPTPTMGGLIVPPPGRPPGEQPPRADR